MYRHLLKCIAIITICALSFSCERKTNDWLQDLNANIPVERLSLVLNQDTVQGASAIIAATYPDEGTISLLNVFKEFDELNFNIAITELENGSYVFSGYDSISVVSSLLGTAITLNGTLSADGTASITVDQRWNGDFLKNWNVCDALLADAESGQIVHAAGFLNWTSRYNSDTLCAENLSAMGTIALHSIIDSYFKDITFYDDLSLSFHYCPDPGLTIDNLIQAVVEGTVPSVVQREWKESPQGMADWFFKDNILYIHFNIGAFVPFYNELTGKNVDADFVADIIMRLDGLAGSEIRELLADLDGVDLEAVLTMFTDEQLEDIVSWLTDGFPLSVTQSLVEVNNQQVTITDLYVNQGFVDTFAGYMEGKLPEMETALKNMTVEVDGETLTGWDYFTYRTGFEAIDEFSRLWEQTYTFRIGTSLVDVPITGN